MVIYQWLLFLINYSKLVCSLLLLSLLTQNKVGLSRNSKHANKFAHFCRPASRVQGYSTTLCTWSLQKKTVLNNEHLNFDNQSILIKNDAKEM